MLNISQTPTVSLQSRFLDSKGVHVLVKRDELTHPLVMGNKWRKLKFNLRAAKSQGKHQLITYGGAFSNHIVATAAATYHQKMDSIGIIRGDELHENSNPSLQLAAQHGMQLVFTARSDYKICKETLTLPAALSHLSSEKLYFLPEGGTNQLAIQGSSEILLEVEDKYDICCTSMGTGGTFLGLLHALKGEHVLYGFSALKGTWIHDEISRLKELYDIGQTNYLLFDDHLFGGYGRFNQNLIQFILEFRQEYDILLDPIYTGKMFFRVWDMIKNDQIARGTTLLMIHTGGLQGIAGFNFRHGQQLPQS